MFAAGSGEIFSFHSYEKGTWRIIYNMETQVVININEDRAAEVKSKSEVQVFQKQLKK
jgi:uncharacterized protein YjlB